MVFVSLFRILDFVVDFVCFVLTRVCFGVGV